MWLISTPMTEEARKREQEEFAKRLQESSKKADDREAFIKSTTCPHCKRHDPIPPWLM